MKAVFDQYTAENPDVTVEPTLIPYGQYWTKLQTSLTSDNGPDVFWLNLAAAVEFYPAGLIQELDAYVERDGVDLSVFPKALVDMYSLDGKLYGIPKDYDTIGLFYNKSLFDAKGLAYPTNDWTWEDLRTAALTLTDGTNYGFIIPPYGQQMVEPWVLSNGGPLITDGNKQLNFNTPETIEALQWMIDRVYVDQVSPTAASMKELSPDEYFQGERVAMITQGSWMVPAYYEALGEKLGVCELPDSPKTGRNGNVIHGLSVNISAKSRNKEAAWGLAKAFTTREAGEAQAKVVIPAYSGADKIWVDSFPGLDLQCFIDAADIAVSIPTCRVAASKQEQIMADVLSNMWMKTIDVASGCAQIDEECAKIVEDTEAGA